MNESLSSIPPQMPLEKTGECWICGGGAFDRVFEDRLALIYSKGLEPYNHNSHAPIYLVKCRSCGFAQPEAMPEESYFNAIYSKDYPVSFFEKNFDCTYRDYIYRSLLNQLEGYLDGAPKTLLDVGTYTGRFVHLAAQAGWESEGAETDRYAVETARRRTGRPIHNCRAQDLDAQERYSAVTLNDVLEHIPKPAAVVAGLGKLLRSGGVLAIKVPHGPPQRWKERFRQRIHRNWLDSRVGVMTNFVHVNHFSVGSMRRMLEQAGFEVIKIAPGAPELPVEIRSLKAALRYGVRMSCFQFAKWFPGGLYSPAAFNLQAIARKK